MPTFAIDLVRGVEMQWLRASDFRAHSAVSYYPSPPKVGWGFTNVSWIQGAAGSKGPTAAAGAGVGAAELGPESKRAHLHAYIQQHLGGRPVVLVSHLD